MSTASPQQTLRTGRAAQRPPDRRPPAWPCVLAALASLWLVGCYGPRYNQPYGYPTGPGSVQPGAPYYPGAPVYPNGSPYDLGAPTFDSGANPGGDAPPYYGNESTNNTGNRPVPDSGYNDAAAGNYFGDPGGSAGASSPGRISSSPDFPASTPSTPAGGIDDYSSPFDMNDFGTDDDFQDPIPSGANPISFEREVTAVTKLPYAHDIAGHRWLQGMVSYDQQDKSWGIVYSINPDRADPYAGYFTLADDPRFSSLKDGDIVRLDGQVDPARTDQLGRPTYTVARITPMSY